MSSQQYWKHRRKSKLEIYDVCSRKSYNIVIYLLNNNIPFYILYKDAKSHTILGTFTVFQENLSINGNWRSNTMLHHLYSGINQKTYPIFVDIEIKLEDFDLN